MYMYVKKKNKKEYKSKKSLKKNKKIYRKKRNKIKKKDYRISIIFNKNKALNLKNILIK